MGDEGAHEQIWGLQNKHQPGKWRPILDLLHPENHSVNAWISSWLRSLTYLKLSEVAEVAVTFDQGAQLAKFDIVIVYRVFQVNPVDTSLVYAGKNV